MYDFTEHVNDLEMSALKEAQEAAEKLQKELATIIDACAAARKAKDIKLAGPAFSTISLSMHIGHLPQAACQVEAQLMRVWSIAETARTARHPNIDVVKDAE